MSSGCGSSMTSHSEFTGEEQPEACFSDSHTCHPCWTVAFQTSFPCLGTARPDTMVMSLRGPRPAQDGGQVRKVLPYTCWSPWVRGLSLGLSFLILLYGYGRV